MLLARANRRFQWDDRVNTPAEGLVSMTPGSCPMNMAQFAGLTGGFGLCLCPVFEAESGCRGRRDLPFHGRVVQGATHPTRVLFCFCVFLRMWAGGWVLVEAAKGVIAGVARRELGCSHASACVGVRRGVLVFERKKVHC